MDTATITTTNTNLHLLLQLWHLAMDTNALTYHYDRHGQHSSTVDLTVVILAMASIFPHSCSHTLSLSPKPLAVSASIVFLRGGEDRYEEREGREGKEGKEGRGSFFAMANDDYNNANDAHDQQRRRWWWR